MQLTSKLDAQIGNARATTFDLTNGPIKTPLFMPVGTRGAVKFIDSTDLKNAGAQIVLGNTYHLMLRPGADVIKQLGGLNSFMNWQHTLTDSGGFQVFSLKPKLSDEGALFKSTYDGSLQMLTPESAVEIQCDIGADIQMVLDVCVELPADFKTIEEGVSRTTLWAKRAREAFLRNPKSEKIAQFGIVQGGTNQKLRRRSVEELVEIGFDGYAIGGLSVGETREELLETISWVIDYLPKDKPRYIMGLGDAVGSLMAVDLGIDMMDCVLPTRIARHGGAFTSDEEFAERDYKMIVTNSRYKVDDSPIDKNCSCVVCQKYSKAYIRHLLKQGVATGHRLMTLHNVTWLISRFDEKRSSILETI